MKRLLVATMATILGWTLAGMGTAHALPGVVTGAATLVGCNGSGCTLGVIVAGGEDDTFTGTNAGPAEWHSDLGLVSSVNVPACDGSGNISGTLSVNFPAVAHSALGVQVSTTGHLRIPVNGLLGAFTSVGAATVNLDNGKTATGLLVAAAGIYDCSGSASGAIASVV